MILDVEIKFNGYGCFLICKFGIELLICVMVECEDFVLLEYVVDGIVVEVVVSI